MISPGVKTQASTQNNGESNAGGGIMIMGGA